MNVCIYKSFTLFIIYFFSQLQSHDNIINNYFFLRMILLLLFFVFEAGPAAKKQVHANNMPSAPKTFTQMYLLYHP